MELLQASRVVTAAPAGVVANGAVLVDASRILTVGTAAEVAARPEARSARRSEFRSGTILPGLVDCHVHLGFDGSDQPVRHFVEAGDEELLAVMRRSAQSLVQAGVTTARDLGSRGRLGQVVKEEIEAGRVPGPRLVAANEPITSTGGHCWFMGCERDDARGIRQAVRQHWREGAEVIKVMATGGFLTEGPDPWDAQFRLDQLRTAVEEAHGLGLPVAAHAHGTVGIRRAVEAGVDTIEHCSWAAEGGVDFDGEVLAAIVEAGVAVCPTTNVRTLQRNQPRARVVVPGLREGRIERIRVMHEAGVRLVAGTDAGVTRVPHDAYAAGLQALAAAGMPPLEVIEAATIRGAESCRVSGDTGSLEAGKLADLLVVNGDPASDLLCLGRPVLVMRAGVPYEPEAASPESSAASPEPGAASPS
jgi:imidazolonepropionase-like amidohydrolase